MCCLNHAFILPVRELMSIITRVIIALCFLSFPFLYKSFFCPFSADKFKLDLPYNAKWEVEQIPIDSILSQRFYFLGKGLQSFAFISEDGCYVLKVFRFLEFHRLT